MDDDRTARVAEFREALDDNPKMKERWENGDDTLEIARAMGFDDLTLDDIADFYAQQEQDDLELKDFELAIVAGGGSNPSTTCYTNRYGVEECEDKDGLPSES